MSIEGFFLVFLINTFFFLSSAIIVNMRIEEKRTKLNIKGITLHQESQLPIILLQSNDEKITIPISIGPFEASAIITELENIHPPRPLTHDLFSEILLRHKFRFKSLYIYKSIKNKYYARISYKKNLRNYSMEVRPSDGIALIIRHGGEIITNNDVIKNITNDYWLSDMDPLSQDFLFLRNNNSDHSFM